MAENDDAKLVSKLRHRVLTAVDREQDMFAGIPLASTDQAVRTYLSADRPGVKDASDPIRRVARWAGDRLRWRQEQED